MSFVAILVGNSLAEMRLAGASNSPELLQLVERVLAEEPTPALTVLPGGDRQQ